MDDVAFHTAYNADLLEGDHPFSLPRMRPDMLLYHIFYLCSLINI
jgi:hypothetical protein